MIITDRFVFVHMPKTGGTFVSTMLRQAHGIASKHAAQAGLLWRWLGVRQGDLVEWKKHGSCRDIPCRHSGKPVVATIRNPYDRYVSQYEFGWWKKYPHTLGDVAAISRRFPTFPDLSFADYVHMTNMFLARGGADDEYPLGWHATQFMDFFVRNPWVTRTEVTPTLLASAAWAAEVIPFRFLRTHRLNTDLFAWLIDMGYPREKIAAVLTSGRIYPKDGGRGEGHRWERYYTPDLKAFVRRREWMLFEMFPEFDV